MSAIGRDSKVLVWIGRVLSALPVLLLIFSAIMKFKAPAGMRDLGYPEHLAVPIAITELACALIYAFPKTSVLGAILITGYLGGATASHVRLEQTAFFAPPIVGVVAWLGLFFRDYRVRALVPWRK